MNQILSSSSVALAIKSILFFAIGIASYEFINHHMSPSTALVSECELTSTPCHVDDATLALETDGVSPMISNTLSVNWDALPKGVDSLMLSLEGHEMMMGTYKLLLTRENNQLFTGDLLLPVCTSDTMTWFGTITPVNDTSHASPLTISVRMTQ